MTRTATLRSLTAADIAALRSLWREGLTRFPLSFLLTAEEADGIPDAVLINGCERGDYWGAFWGEQLVAFAALRKNGLMRMSHTADLGPFYVAEGFQRQGVAKALLGRMLVHATEQGLRQVELCVDLENTSAQALYRQAGFRPFGVRPRSVVVDGRPRHDVLMLCPLDDMLAPDDVANFAQQVLG
ncbi:GNAT family N-acetyltransferase [Phaeobacter porticola]|uniref:Putative acetyltransferase n=1 Tax=Phaeobacter porticola TaxID=1844006 RepID=A0A1L3I8G5_9RHOB|nr:GNAT family N-acetyltransferase [Phaeobacter porticola]APG48489.1 putative acetyltransferase [Phaeobacter porticola]